MKLSDVKWSDPDSRWRFIQGREQHRRQRFLSQYREWFIDVAHYAGFQYIFHDQRKRIWENPAPLHRIRSITNFLMPQARAFVSNLARVEPVWDVLAATKQQEDREIAQLNTDISHHYWQRLRLYYKYIKALFWTATTGNGFLKCVWDPTLGEEIDVNEEVDGLDELFQSLGLPTDEDIRRRARFVKTGDMAVDWKSPFELMFQPGIDDIRDSLYSIESNIRDPYVIESKYGKHDLHSESELIKNGLFYLDKLANLTGPIGTISSQDPNRQRIIVYDVYIKPHERLKRGKHFIMAQGKDLIPSQKFPYDHGMLPYAHFPEVPIPGQLWGTSTLHQNRRSQKIINRFDSQIIEYIDLMLKGKWLVPRGSRLGKNAITDAPGEKIVYNHPFIPTQARLQTLPRSVFDERTILKKGMEDVASNHEPTQGKAVGSVRSAALAQELKEGDLAILGPTQVIHDTALMDIGRMILSNAAQFVSEERLISVVRSGKLAVSRTFTGSMMVGESEQLGADYFNTVINRTGRTPWNKLGNQQLITALAGANFLRPGEHDQVVLKAVGLEDAETVFELAEQARSLQSDENKRLDEGEEVPVEKTNLHSIHREIITLRLENTNDLDDKAIEAYRKHWDEHWKAEVTVALIPEILKSQILQQLQTPQPAPAPAPARGGNGRIQ